MSKSSEVADAEGASSSSKEEIIKGLNEDLSREYKAIIQYVVFSQTLKGAEYGDIAEQLKEHASQELAHALEVARQIDYLGGDPTVNVKGAEYSQDSKKMLEIDLKQEQETIKSRSFCFFFPLFCLLFNSTARYTSTRINNMYSCYFRPHAFPSEIA
jgi:bacterioferritin